jgi:hypothetical protein
MLEPGLSNRWCGKPRNTHQPGNVRVPRSGVTAFDVLYDTLREHGHRPGLHIIADRTGAVERAWLTAAGVGALGGDAEHAARLYVEAGAALTADEPLRDELRRLRPLLAA